MSAQMTVWIDMKVTKLLETNRAASRVSVDSVNTHSSYGTLIWFHVLVYALLAPVHVLNNEVDSDTS
eukprot:1158252-Pelagomonas_calceolata.AAC.4